MANSVDSDQSVLGPCCLLLYLIRQLCYAIICSRRLQHTTFSDAFFIGALRVIPLPIENLIGAGQSSFKFILVYHDYYP